MRLRPNADPKMRYSWQQRDRAQVCAHCRRSVHFEVLCSEVLVRNGRVARTVWVKTTRYAGIAQPNDLIALRRRQQLRRYDGCPLGFRDVPYLHCASCSPSASRASTRALQAATQSCSRTCHRLVRT